MIADARKANNAIICQPLRGSAFRCPPGKGLSPFAKELPNKTGEQLLIAKRLWLFRAPWSQNELLTPGAA